ncbi:hypothetical protein ACF07B_15480 [Streptomyces sp. NPDC015532]|uniref:hypothetical protein n=1 Tax=Streptomyces sp. NPDC015532 TaxID=3364960 RepID=UPI0036FBA10F
MSPYKLTPDSPGYRTFMDAAFCTVAFAEHGGVEVPRDVQWAFTQVATPQGIHVPYRTVRHYLRERGIETRYISGLGKDRYCVGIILRDEYANPN